MKRQNLTLSTHEKLNDSLRRNFARSFVRPGCYLPHVRPGKELPRPIWRIGIPCHVPKLKDNFLCKPPEKQQKSTCTFCQVAVDLTVGLISRRKPVDIHDETGPRSSRFDSYL